MARKSQPLRFAFLSFMLRSFILLALTLCCAPVDAKNDEASSRLTKLAGETMGTTYHISFVKPSDQKVESIQKEIKELLEKVENQMSTYRKDSEITRFNQLQSTEPFEISAEFAEVVKEAMRISELTNGQFDMTVGPLVKFWGFGTGTPRTDLPTKAEIESVLNRIGFRKLRLIEGTPNRLQKTLPDLQIDLSAIAKGYAVDLVAKKVAEFSPSYLVEIGGEVNTGGGNPDLESGSEKQPWVIGIERPTSSPLDTGRSFLAKANLTSLSLATSGDYRNIQLIEGKRFQHTINPKSGMPVDHGVYSVSVAHESCMTADGLATALMVYPPAELKQFCQSNDLSVLIAYRENGKLVTWENKFPGVILTKPQPQSDASKQSEKKKDEQGSFWLTVVATVSIFALVILGMSVGVIISNRQIKGSCGGLSAMSEEGVSSPCSLCSKPASACPKKAEEENKESAAKDHA